MWVFVLLILLFFIPILLTCYNKHMHVLNFKKTIVPKAIKLPPQVKEVSLIATLKANEAELSFHHVKAVGTSEMYVKKLYIWIDLGNVHEEEEEDLVQLDILTNDLTSGTDYASILSKPITISRRTPSRLFLNISAHLGTHALSPDSVLMIKRDTKIDHLIVPTLLTLEYGQAKEKFFL
jgi:hypothetical protein